MIRKIATALFMSASLVGCPRSCGCDREVAKTETVKDGPGGTRSRKRRSRRRPTARSSQDRERRPVAKP